MNNALLKTEDKLMTAKEFLQQYRDCEKYISAKQEECERLKTLATKTTQALSGVIVQGTPSDKMSIVDKLIDIENQIKPEIDKLKKARDDINKVIMRIPDIRIRTVLHLRYICGNKWEQIAVKMNYDYRWVLHLHGQGLQYIDKIINSH